MVIVLTIAKVPTENGLMVAPAGTRRSGGGPLVVCLHKGKKIYIRSRCHKMLDLVCRTGKNLMDRLIGS